MNILLVFYFGLLFLFLLASFAIIYHLQAFQLNERIATFTSLLFIAGAFILLAVNVVSAIQVDWDQFPRIIFL